jgi:hypothetical protein
MLLAIACSNNASAVPRKQPTIVFRVRFQTRTVTHPMASFPQLSNPRSASRSFYAEIFPWYHQVFEYKLELDTDGIGDLTLVQIPESVDYRLCR